MDILLVILGFAALLTGLAGAVLPLPGPPLSFVGLLCLHFSSYVEFGDATLYTFGFVTLVITFLDYYVPIWGIKKFGGTSYGTWGSTIGVVVGLFLIPAIGIFFGAFLGAFLGEIIGGLETNKALKAAFGSFLGFLSGIFMKIALCVIMIIFAVKEFF